MAYKHGIYGSEIPTSLLPMTESDAGLPVVFGTAPVHLATDAAKPNTPVLCYTLKEAKKKFGYSDDFDSYTLCEAMSSHFALYGMAPIVFVNVLDTSNDDHTQKVTGEKVTLTSLVAKLDASQAVLLDTLVVKATADGTALVSGTDYTAAYNDDNKLVITALDGGALASATEAYIDYTALKPSGVTASNIVGGDGKGLELVSEVFPRFGLVPGTLIAPKFSSDSTVAAVMKAKTENINGCFEAIAIADAPSKKDSTFDLTDYTKVSEWKNKMNYVDERLILCWPMLSLGGVKYHMSTQLASLLCKSDSEHDNVPYWSASNQSVQADSAVTENGEEVYLGVDQADYLNGNGVVTAINFIGGWKAWGNRTTAYPSNTDVKDAFIPIRRMFNWVNNTLITTFWSKIDNPTNKRLISTIVDSANIWFNGLVAKRYLLGGRVEFREDENTTTDLMDGKIYFHVYITPPSPARDIEFVQEYDPNYISTLFE